MSRSKTVLGAALVLGILAALAGYAGLQAMARQVVASTSKQFIQELEHASGRPQQCIFDNWFGQKWAGTQLLAGGYFP